MSLYQLSTRIAEPSGSRVALGTVCGRAVGEVGLVSRLIAWLFPVPLTVAEHKKAAWE